MARLIALRIFHVLSERESKLNWQNKRRNYNFYIPTRLFGRLLSSTGTNREALSTVACMHTHTRSIFAICIWINIQQVLFKSACISRHHTVLVMLRNECANATQCNNDWNNHVSFYILWKCTIFQPTTKIDCQKNSWDRNWSQRCRAYFDSCSSSYKLQT